MDGLKREENNVSVLERESINTIISVTLLSENIRIIYVNISITQSRIGVAVRRFSCVMSFKLLFEF